MFRHDLQAVFPIDSVREIPFRLVDSAIDPHRILFVLKEPRAERLPVQFSQFYFAEANAEMWEQFQRSPHEEQANAMNGKTGWRYPVAKQVWAIYKHGYRYLLEIVTNQGRVLLTNACTTSRISELNGWNLVCIAYEPTLLWQYYPMEQPGFREPRVSRPHDIALPDYPETITERSCETVLKVIDAERSFHARGDQDAIQIIENSLNNCAYFCRSFKQNEWEVIQGFSVLFSLYPRIPHEEFLKFVSIHIQKSENVGNASLEARESFISLQHYIVAFDRAVDGFLNDLDLMEVFTMLKTACFCLRLKEGVLVQIAGEFMATLLQGLRKGSKPRGFNSEGLNSDDWLFIAAAIFGTKDVFAVLKKMHIERPHGSAKKMPGLIPWDAIMARRDVERERRTREAVLKRFRDHWKEFRLRIRREAEEITWRFQESFTQHSFQVIREPIFD
jgi:hypothetical protein